MSGPAGLTPLHLAAVLQDHGACARSLVKADGRMSQAWVSLQTADGKTPQDLARQAGLAALLDSTSSWQERESPAHCKSLDSGAYQRGDQHGHPNQLAACPFSASASAPTWSPPNSKRKRGTQSHDREVCGAHWTADSREGSSLPGSPWVNNYGRQSAGQTESITTASQAFSSSGMSKRTWHGDQKPCTLSPHCSIIRPNMTIPASCTKLPGS